MLYNIVYTAVTTLYGAPEYNDELYDQMTRFMSDGLAFIRPHNTHIIIGK